MDTLVVVLLFAIDITAFVLQGMKRIPAEKCRLCQQPDKENEFYRQAKLLRD